MGGTNEPHNLTEPITIHQHATMHKDLWLKHGFKEDYIAWKCLSGRMTNEEARLAAAKIGQEKSEAYKQSRKNCGEFAKQSGTTESRSKGGKAASKALVAWQKQNAQKFKEQASLNGKNKAPTQWIPHKYLGVIYQSKKSLQAAHSMSICGFYGKLRRGEIERLPKYINREIEKRSKS